MWLLENDEKRWVDKYIHGIIEPSKAIMDFGKCIHESLEKGDFWHENLEVARSMIPTDAISEKEELIRVDWRGQEIFLHGFVDWKTEDHVYEIKTGVSKWTQERVDNHGQLDFYALIYDILGKPIQDFTLIYIQTMAETAKFKLFIDGKPNHSRINKNSPLAFHRKITDLNPICERIDRYIERATYLRSLFNPLQNDDTPIY